MSRIPGEYFDKDKKPIKKAPFVPEERSYDDGRAISLGFSGVALFVLLLASFITMPLAVIIIAACVLLASIIAAGVAHHYGNEGLTSARRTNEAIKVHNQQVNVHLEQEKKEAVEKAKVDAIAKKQEVRMERIQEKFRDMEERMFHKLDIIKLDEQLDKETREIQELPTKKEEAEQKKKEEERKKLEEERKIVERRVRFDIPLDGRSQNQAREEVQGFLQRVDDRNLDHAYHNLCNIRHFESYLAQGNKRKEITRLDVNGRSML